jgi:hypothetical protein
MKITIYVAAAALVAASAATVSAGEIRQRMNTQDRRIENGVENGELTPREANRLENQQETIADERARARADGHMSRGERREIHHDQRAASHTIWRKKHNARRY